MTIEGLIFDKDGTLYDFQKTWGGWAQGLFTGLFGPHADAISQRMGFDPVAQRFLPDSPVIAETTETLARMMLPDLPGWSLPQLVARMKEEAHGVELVEAVPLHPLFEALSARGLRLGLATNDDESTARRHLEHSGVAGLIPFVAGYDSGWGGKPAPGQLRAFLDWAGLAPERVAMVGDSRHDLEAGRAAGLHTVGVLTGPAQQADIADLADAVLPDISHLPAWLDRTGGA